MRVLHTADWHLCNKLGDNPKNDRTADLHDRVAIIAALCHEHTVDVLVIAGDVFCDRASLEQIEASLLFIYAKFREFFQRGGTILAITGNHDRDNKLNMVRAGMNLAMPCLAAGECLPAGRMYLLNKPAVLTLKCVGGVPANFVLLPYPFVSRFNLETDKLRTKEETNLAVRTAVVEQIQKFGEKLNGNPHRTVLVAHMNVRGSETNSLYRLTEADDHMFEFGELKTHWAYVALGHIHKPQKLNGAEHVRYPGSLDRLDFGETHAGHGVLLFDIVPGNIAPAHLPIPATPFWTIELTEPETQMAEWASKLEATPRAIVQVRVQSLGSYSRDELHRLLKKTFPRLHEVQWNITSQVQAQANAANPRGELNDVVRKYITARTEGDAEQARVLELLEQFLSQGGAA